MWDDEFFRRRCIGWQLKLCLWPRHCYYTGKSIWLTLSYKGTAMVTGPGTPVFEHRWVDRDAFLFLKIRGKI